MTEVIQEYKRVMVAVDGSDSAERAFKKATRIAVRNHSDLVIAHVVDTRTYSMGMPALYTEGIVSESEVMTEQLEKYKQEAQA